MDEGRGSVESDGKRVCFGFFSSLVLQGKGVKVSAFGEVGMV